LVWKISSRYIVNDQKIIQIVNTQFFDFAETNVFTDNAFFLETTEFQSMFIQLAFYFIAGKKMSPKKRRGIVSTKPGVARGYLQENFGSFPTSAGEVMLQRQPAKLQ